MRRPNRRPFLCLFWGMKRAARRCPLCSFRYLGIENY
nr:MAG TPA: Protein of unknown function (DUF983) [Caudoviricetes sp.]